MMDAKREVRQSSPIAFIQRVPKPIFLGEQESKTQNFNTWPVALDTANMIWDLREGSGDLLRLVSLNLNLDQIVKEILNLGREYSYLVCSLCYSHFNLSTLKMV